MFRLPPRSTLSAARLPYPTLFLSASFYSSRCSGRTRSGAGRSRMADGSLGIGRIPARLKKKSKKVADLFCGASGMGSGAKRAITELGHDITLVGVNHWEPAIRTSQMNHPGDTFLCADQLGRESWRERVCK